MLDHHGSTWRVYSEHYCCTLAYSHTIMERELYLSFVWPPNGKQAMQVLPLEPLHARCSAYDVAASCTPRTSANCGLFRSVAKNQLSPEMVAMCASSSTKLKTAALSAACVREVGITAAPC